LLRSKGLMLKAGTVVDATLIAAPSSTKNASGERDPEMHQSKKGNQWHFGMKAHIGVDAQSGLVHTVRGTAANVNDVVEANSLLHGKRPTSSPMRATRGRQAARRQARSELAHRHAAQQAQGAGQDPPRGRVIDQIERSRPASGPRSSTRSG
jgi:IS5 family transposase